MDSTPNTLAQPWQPAQKIGFRFAFIFFVLFIFFDPNGQVPLLNETYDLYIQPMHNLMAWMAAHILHVAKPVTVFTNGSGDTTYDYLVLLTVAVSALIGTIIWTALSRKPVSYQRLYYWLLVILRFYVAFSMLGYGAYKVVKLQFPFPGPGRLLESYGNSSPMGIAWSFIGASKGYNYFTGTAELLCGILLLFRRTATLGAVIALTVIVNIAAINYCYDVPVKIVSSTLVLMTLFILGKELHRFMLFFIANKPVPPANLTAHRFGKQWKNITLVVFKYLLIAYMVIGIGQSVYYGAQTYGDDVKHTVLYGIFNTQKYVLKNDTLPPLDTDTLRWRRMVINSYGGVTVSLMNDSTRYYKLKIDQKKSTITLSMPADSNKKFSFNYTLSKDSVLNMQGNGPHGPLNATFKRFDEKKFLLRSRGFHWVNEYPFNK